MSAAASAAARLPRLKPAAAGNRAVLIALLLLALGLLGSLVYPFAGSLIFAAVLAGALHPCFCALRSWLRGRAIAAATLLTVAVALLIAVPAVLLTVSLGRQVLAGADYVGKTLREGGVIALIDDLPPSVATPLRKAVDRAPGGPSQLQGLAEQQEQKAAAVVTGAVVATSTAAVKIALMLVAFFFLLLDGPRLVQWFATVAPLPEAQILAILTDFRNVSVGVLVSSLATAGVQTASALAGYLVAGVPEPVFFALVTFLAAFVPAVGATAVVLAMAALLLVTDHAREALGLALWGVLFVSFIDNLVKPMLLKGRMEIHGGLIFFALVGGLATFGPVGLVAGPLILSFFMTVVRLCRHEPLPAEV